MEGIAAKMLAEARKREKLAMENAVLERKKKLQPDFIYHGTSTVHLEDILSKGIVGGENHTEDRNEHLDSVFLSTNMNDSAGYAGRSKNMRGGDE